MKVNKPLKTANQEINVIVTALRKNNWGKVLWDACLQLNGRLVKRWRDYVWKVKAGNFDGLKEYESLLAEKDGISVRTDELRRAVAEASKIVTVAYRNYVAAIPDNDIVRQYKEFEMLSARGGVVLPEELKAIRDKYNGALQQRKDKYAIYLLKKDELQEVEERYNNHIKDTSQRMKYLNSKVSNLFKRLKRCDNFEFADIDADNEKMCEILASKELAERLFIVSHGNICGRSKDIFNAEFSSYERELVMERFFDRLLNCSLNYDFALCCYKLIGDKLHLISTQKIFNTIYNGYFATIRGCMFNSFNSVNFEHNMKDSINDTSMMFDSGDESRREDWLFHPDRLNNNDIVEEGTMSVYTPRKILDKYIVDEFTISFWERLKSYLFDNMIHMASKLADLYCRRYKYEYIVQRGDVYNTMQKALSIILEKITVELQSRRTIGTKINHIIIDGFEGLVVGSEKNFVIDSVQNILKFYIKRFFLDNLRDLMGSEVEMMFDNSDTKEVYLSLSRTMAT